MMAFVLVLAVVGMIASAVLFYRARLGKDALGRNHGRAIRYRVMWCLRPGPGFASLPELVTRWGKFAMRRNGRRVRPGMSRRDLRKASVTDYAVRLGRAQFGRTAYSRMEDNTLILAPPRIGSKTTYLASMILDHPGAAVTTTTRADLADLTAGERSKLGPVDVFNPLGIGGIPSTVAWNPVVGCADPNIAFLQAQRFIGDLDDGDMRFWESKASVALAALFHAAALAPGAPGTIVDVFAWAQRYSDDLAMEILTGTPGASPILAAAMAEIRKEGKSSDSIRMTLTRSLAWAAIPPVVAATTSGRSIDPVEFAASRGTLYLIAPGDDSSPIAPLFRAFVSHIHYAGGLAGSYVPARKLDPPMLFALDEVAQVCPVPLPQWLADSAGKGIRIASVFHDMAQAASIWGPDGARVVWTNSVTKVVLPGVTDGDTLENISRICGSTNVDRGEQKDSVPIVPVEMARILPDFRALIIRGNLSPTIVRIEKTWKRKLAPLPLLTPLTESAPGTLLLRPEGNHERPRPAGPVRPPIVAKDDDEDAA